MTFDEQYQQIIDDQRTYLLKLQDEFNKACDEAKRVAQEKLAAVSEGDTEARNAIIQEQKTTLEAVLSKLKGDIHESTRATMHALEHLVREKEKKILEQLEQQIAAI